MESTDNLKNRLINRILASKNEKFLEAIEGLFITTQKEDIINLTSSQKEMIKMGLKDIEEGNIFSETELEKLDNEWLN